MEKRNLLIPIFLVSITGISTTIFADEIISPPPIIAETVILDESPVEENEDLPVLSNTNNINVTPVVFNDENDLVEEKTETPEIENEIEGETKIEEDSNSNIIVAGDVGGPSFEKTPDTIPQSSNNHTTYTMNSLNGPGMGLAPIYIYEKSQYAQPALSYALVQIGKPYSQANRNKEDSFDCSSLVWWAYKRVGIDISLNGSNTAADICRNLEQKGLTVPQDQMRPGDLIFFASGTNGRYKNINHVAMYAGNNTQVEAKGYKDGVVLSKLRDTGIVSICRVH